MSAVATAVSAAGTLVLAFLTFRYVEATKEMARSNAQMVEEARESREAQDRANRDTLEMMRSEREARERPRVRVDIDYDNQPFLYVVVRNLGGGPATSVRFKFSPELVTPLGDGSVDYLSSGLRIFRKGIDFLPAGAEIPIRWGVSRFIVGYFYEKKIDRHGTRVEVSYRSLDGQNYEERLVLNPVDMENAMSQRQPNLGQLIDPVVRAAEKIEKAIDHKGYVRTKSATERTRELRTIMDRVTDAGTSPGSWWRRMFGR